MRVSTTTLESFRLFMAPDQEWMSEADLIESIKGVWAPNRKALLGTAYGKVLESPDTHRGDGGYRCGEFYFGPDVVDPALVEIDRRGVFEAKATKQYGECMVVAKADHLYGAHLSEYKTTLSTFDVQKYLDSYQWRFMVDLFEPRVITYKVFCLSESAAGHIDLRSIEVFNVYPYPALHTDCGALLRQFTEYVMAKGLDGLLRERQAAA